MFIVECLRDDLYSFKALKILVDIKACNYKKSTKEMIIREVIILKIIVFLYREVIK